MSGSKNVHLCPVYKGYDRRDMGNYRPISFLPIISKAFEKELFQQLYQYLKVNSILSKFPSQWFPPSPLDCLRVDSNMR